MTKYLWPIALLLSSCASHDTPRTMPVLDLLGIIAGVFIHI